MNSKLFMIDPVPKPRMTRSDKWKKRDCTDRYWAFKDELLLQAQGFKMPECNYHLKFFLRMPEGWSEKKKKEFDGKPHQQKPDKDNLEKAFLDSLCVEDKNIWDGRVSKFWSRKGYILIEF